MSELSGYAVIHQVQAEEGNHLLSGTKQINAYLKYGWKIISIDKRGYDHREEGSFFATIFVLGHTDVDAKHPTCDTYSKVWS